MKKLAKEIAECLKAQVKSIGIDNFEGQNLDDLKDWTEIIKNLMKSEYYCTILKEMESAEYGEDYDYEGRKRKGYSMTVDEYRQMPEYYRDMDRSRGKMYYTQPLQDMREGRSGKMRRHYMESKEMHKGNTNEDKQAKLTDLDKYMTELGNDVKEMIMDATPEEKTMLKQKMINISNAI